MSLGSSRIWCGEGGRMPARVLLAPVVAAWS